MTAPTGPTNQQQDEYIMLTAMEENVASLVAKVDALTALLTGALTDPVDGHTQSILTLARRAVTGQK